MHLRDTTVAIVGLGLMGGSLGLALKQNRAARRIIGVARRAETVSQALEMEVCDDAGTDLAAGVSQADLIVLATPVRTILAQLSKIGAFARPGSAVIDLGSTKQAICQAMDGLPPHLAGVGGHPMCGKETAGLDVAEAGLYRDKVFVLCRTARTTPPAWNLCQELVQTVGSQLVILAPERHDELVATISHLPYLVSATLSLTAGQIAQADPQTWTVAASGFRDTSRLASSDVTMLMDILLTNKTAVVELAQRYITHLQTLVMLLERGGEDELKACLETARHARLDYVAAARGRAAIDSRTEG